MSNTFRKIVQFPLGAQTTKMALLANELVPLHQVESLIAGNVSIKEAVSVDVEADFDIATGGLPILDGYQVLNGDRALLHGQTDSSENGIYVASAGAWVRAGDADDQAELPPYTRVSIIQGDHAGRVYHLTNETAPVVDTDVQTWSVTGAISSAAGDITVDQSNFSEITGATVQAISDSIDDKLANLSSGVTTIITDTNNSRFTSNVTTLTQGIAINFNHSINEHWLSGIKVYDATTKEDITHTVVIKSVDADNITVQNDDVDLDVVVSCRK